MATLMTSDGSIQVDPTLTTSDPFSSDSSSPLLTYKAAQYAISTTQAQGTSFRNDLLGLFTPPILDTSSVNSAADPATASLFQLSTYQALLPYALIFGIIGFFISKGSFARVIESAIAGMAVGYFLKQMPSTTS